LQSQIPGCTAARVDCSVLETSFGAIGEENATQKKVRALMMVARGDFIVTVVLKSFLREEELYLRKILNILRKKKDMLVHIFS
jgi:hypothetical protein